MAGVAKCPSVSAAVAFVSLCAAPPGTRLRSAVARRAFSTISAAPGRTHIYTAKLIPTSSFYKTGFRSQSSAASSNNTPIPPSASTTPPSSTSNDTTSHTSGPRKTSRIRSILFTSSLIVIFLSAGLTMAAIPHTEAVNGFLNPPSDEETLTLFDPPTPTSAEINEHIVNHPLAQQLRQQEGMVESRPHLKIPPAMRPHNLTAGTLLGENMIEVPPLTFSEKDAELPTLVQLSYLGPALCGHPGIVHGGLLATMLDEGLARACFPALPNKVGVTASLKIDYRVPCPGSSYVVLKAQTTKVEGRKAWVKGWIELLGEEDGTGTKVVEAEALFIEPKQAKQMARVYSTT